MSASCNGQVITFYSYKGGTGRTMAMANVAWIIASSGSGCSRWTGILSRPAWTGSSSPSSKSRGRRHPGVIELINDDANEALKGMLRPDDWYLEFARSGRGLL